MYKDSYGNIECADSIICPFCDNEFYDSYEYLPRDQDGKLSWDQDCDECGKTFHVSFDTYNQSDGFTCKKICKKHQYKWNRKDTYKKHDLKYFISTTSDVYRCRKCGDIKFKNTKPDGTEYSRQEINAWKKEKKKSDFKKDNPECNSCEGFKEITVRFHDTCIIIDSEKPEGNEQVFKAVNRLLKSKGFDVYVPERFEKDYKVLKRWHRELNRQWLYCEAEFSRNSIKYEFFQEVYTENRNGGVYDFDKYQKMDTKMQTEFRSIRKLIIDFLYKKYAVIPEKVEVLDWHGYVNNPSEINKKFPGMIVEKYSGKDFEPQYNEGHDINKNPVHNGDFMGAYDDHGRLWVGRMYNRCGTYKYMVHNDRTYSLFPTYKCFPLTGNDPRKIIPEKSIGVLKGLLEKSVKEQDLEKAIVYMDRIKVLGEKDENK